MNWEQVFTGATCAAVGMAWGSYANLDPLGAIIIAGVCFVLALVFGIRREMK
jgi:hypothetical protein